jgi:hypothetical protein
MCSLLRQVSGFFYTKGLLNWMTLKRSWLLCFEQWLGARCGPRPQFPMMIPTPEQSFIEVAEAAVVGECARACPCSDQQRQQQRGPAQPVCDAMMAGCGLIWSQCAACCADLQRMCGGGGGGGGGGGARAGGNAGVEGGGAGGAMPGRGLALGGYQRLGPRNGPLGVGLPVGGAGGGAAGGMASGPTASGGAGAGAGSAGDGGSPTMPEPSAPPSAVEDQADLEMSSRAEGSSAGLSPRSVGGAGSAGAAADDGPVGGGTRIPSDSRLLAAHPPKNGPGAKWVAAKQRERDRRVTAAVNARMLKQGGGAGGPPGGAPPADDAV